MLIVLGYRHRQRGGNYRDLLSTTCYREGKDPETSAQARDGSTCLRLADAVSGRKHVASSGTAVGPRSYSPSWARLTRSLLCSRKAVEFLQPTLHPNKLSPSR